MNAPCSGAICIMLMPPSSAVVRIRSCCTASGGVPWATRYSWTSAPRKKDLGSAMRRPYARRSGVRVAAERLGGEHLEGARAPSPPR